MLCLKIRNIQSWTNSRILKEKEKVKENNLFSYISFSSLSHSFFHFLLFVTRQERQRELTRDRDWNVKTSRNSGPHLVQFCLRQVWKTIPRTELYSGCHFGLLSFTSHFILSLFVFPLILWKNATLRLRVRGKERERVCCIVKMRYKV